MRIDLDRDEVQHLLIALNAYDRLVIVDARNNHITDEVYRASIDASVRCLKKLRALEAEYRMRSIVQTGRPGHKVSEGVDRGRPHTAKDDHVLAIQAGRLGHKSEVK